jgi:hypothetical protein
VLSGALLVGHGLETVLRTNCAASSGGTKKTYKMLLVTKITESN